jgi:FixJ family two-component response regulator
MPSEAFKVYVVDDDVHILSAMKRLLRSFGYDVETFESAEGFLDCCASLGKGVLLLDIRLPEMNGLDLYEKLCSAGLKRQVIFMTAHENPQWKKRAMNDGALAYLIKPFPEKELIDAIRVSCRDGPISDTAEQGKT